MNSHASELLFHSCGAIHKMRWAEPAASSNKMWLVRAHRIRQDMRESAVITKKIIRKYYWEIKAIIVDITHPFLHLPEGKKRQGGLRLPPNDGLRKLPRRLWVIPSRWPPGPKLSGMCIGDFCIPFGSGTALCAG